MTEAEHIQPLRLVGRCELFGEIGSGGMATVHFGRLVAAGGFEKIVAIKRMHEQLAKDPQFVAMFLDEARLVARIKHPNVRPTLDLIEEDGELFIVMEYVAGITLRRLFMDLEERGDRMPPGIALHIMGGVLHGLHAAHGATGPNGESLELVHRDVSPENILIGVDGLARLLDFGMAKALGRLHLTQPGLVKGKLTVMAPEQVQGKAVSRRTDVFASGVVLWQALTSRRLIEGDHIAGVANNVLNQKFETPSSIVPSLTRDVDEVVMMALERDPDARWQSAEEMAVALEATGMMATQRRVADWLEKVAGAQMVKRGEKVAAIERTPIGLEPLERTSRRGVLTSSPHDYPGVGGDVPPSSRGPAWTATALGTARRALQNVGAALRGVKEGDGGGARGHLATARAHISQRPRAAIAVAVALAASLLVIVIALGGDDDDVSDAASSASTDAATAAAAKAPSASASASAPASGSAPAPQASTESVGRLAVPAGEFLLGCNTWADRLCAPDELPAQRVHVAAFAIDRTEVTVSRYQACVAAGGCDEVNLGSQGEAGRKLEEIDKCNYGRTGREEHPINCVSFAQAQACCAWAGGRLPTEEEWEKAAAGSDSWPYPTGDASIDCNKAVMSEGGDGCGRGTTWPVGSKRDAASPYGALDMAGNVWEWVADSYSPRHRARSGDEASEPLPPPPEVTMRVVRGGSWRDQAARQLRTSMRGKRTPDTHAIEVGFRCAYDAAKD